MKHRLVIVIKGGMVEAVHVPTRLKHLHAIVVDKDEGVMEDPDIAEDVHTERLHEIEYSDAPQPTFTNYYRCVECKTKWTDLWSCAVDTECPKCGHDHSPYRYTIDPEGVTT